MVVITCDIIVTEMQASRQHHRRPTAPSARPNPARPPERSHRPVLQQRHQPAAPPLLDQGNRSLSLASSHAVGRKRKVASGSIGCDRLDSMSRIRCPSYRPFVLMRRVFSLEQAVVTYRMWLMTMADWSVGRFALTVTHVLTDCSVLALWTV